MLYYYRNDFSEAIVFVEEFELNKYVNLYKLLSGHYLPKKWKIRKQSFYKPLTDEQKLKYL